MKITEHDDFWEKDIDFTVDDHDWQLAEQGDKDAACRVAAAIEAQSPDSLEIVAKYMCRAADLGSDEALYWVEDYYTPVDQSAEPYS